jgi:LPXTG-motif cell wall-anchored protein
MNVHFPGEGEGWTFFAILGLMAFALVSLIALFRRRGWL